jgi:hypothetical protein
LPQSSLYGGPLTSQTAAGYLEFAPSLNVDKVNTPLLMEFAAIGKNYGATSEEEPDSFIF